MKIKALCLILAGLNLLVNFAFAATPAEMVKVAAMIKRDYNSCIYSDSGGRPDSPQMFNIPAVSCGAVSVNAKPPKAICDTYVTCAAPAQFDIVFHVRCFSLDGKTCPAAKACRDGIDLESYNSEIEAGGTKQYRLDQKGVTGATSQ